jgi:hypothetical protein
MSELQAQVQQRRSATAGMVMLEETAERDQSEVIGEDSPLFHPIMRWRKEYCHPLTIMSRSYQSEAKQRQST